MSDLYADIRPFNDLEVKPALDRLLASDEMMAALLKYRFPKAPGILQPLLQPLFKSLVQSQFKRLNSVEAFQLWMEPKVAQLLQQSTDTVEVSGLDQLDPEKTHVWISNHRDIAMDPTMINYSLHLAGWPTSRIAIGDNLLENPDVADVMRLNKSFVVKRNIDNNRQKLKELQRLSAYIRHSVSEGESIWIAQREGRAKDNIDRTDTAVLKMLALHGRSSKESFSETMQQLNPVPVSIQYEWDPCDVLKARELVMLAQTGSYQKEDEEDVRSILLGLTGCKGKVKVNFGRPLTQAEVQDADTMANCIDQQLADMAEIWPVHWAAAELLQPESDLALPEGTRRHEVDDKKVQLEQRLSGVSDSVRQQMLTNYAVGCLSDTRN
ncbi:1-acyl-sn-glycerol-3-phosphate acyltransferase [Bacterioplanoides sp.]|uniref:1-acyl-sn-glycerol-3-phosphate acyltransferase n=1 Tax=Bacterioplanoides sp. TaxID=2066072 RepID=UPI003AFF7F10